LPKILTAQHCSWRKRLFVVGVAALCFEVVFYFVHRCLHTRLGFKYIHHTHHEMANTIAFGAVYCHPLEYVFGNFAPGVIGLYLTKPHDSTTVRMLSALAAVSVCCSHSGYGGQHVWHHAKLNRVFGFLGLCDSIFNTDLTS
jgi:sterol desaturase/sphingolipid hydroxylase (fatty acid hydroxylase superfamily)